MQEIRTTMAVFASLLFALLHVHVAIAHTFQYVYEPQWALGIRGWIRVKYLEDTGAHAQIKWKLDFSHVDTHAIQQADGNCTQPITMYMWHIHVKWSSNHTSESLAHCALPLTGNHYDPLHACGPNSEFAGTPACLGKQYMCNPAAYAQDFHACEKGDLAGKFGAFKLDKWGKTSGEHVDEHYPQVAENTPQWNIVLHAMCGKATPRVACAVGRLMKKKENDKSHDQDQGKLQVGHDDHRVLDAEPSSQRKSDCSTLVAPSGSDFQDSAAVDDGSSYPPSDEQTQSMSSQNDEVSSDSGSAVEEINAADSHPSDA